MSDNKGLPTIAVIAAALTMVLGTYLIPSGAFATVLPSAPPPEGSVEANNENVSSTSGSEQAQPMSSENANDVGSLAAEQPTSESTVEDHQRSGSSQWGITKGRN
jgi:hypothetical protein